ncbi:hypothetical protein CC79DRAFT_1371066 [Sarocladium strictum]
MQSVLTYLTLLATITAQVHAKGYDDGSDEPGRSCGFKIAPCSPDMTCIPDSDDCTDMTACGGHCEFTNVYPPCGARGINGPIGVCDEKTETCVDDPRTPDACGMACDAPGLCLKNDVPQCGGFAGFQCPEGLFCYDLPDDGCDPENGGADCIGICL